MAKKEKATRKTLRTELPQARKAIESLQRLKAVLPMIQSQRDMIDIAIVAIKFAWRSYKLEQKIGEKVTLQDYAERVLRTSLPPVKWREIKSGKRCKWK